MKTKPAEKLASLEWELEQVMAEARAFEERYRVQLDQLHPEQRESGLNLLHYLALRHRDAQKLQEDLSALGLSSLGRAEGHVLSHLRAVHHALRALQGRKGKRRKGPVTFKKGRSLLRRNTHALLGKKLKGSVVRIMVTLPLEAADDPDLVRGLLEAGMNCARINCAQGGPAEWERMLANVQRARKATGRACRTFMDLAGPRIRTGPLVPGDRVLAVRPSKDSRGFVREPEVVVLVPEPSESASVAAVPQAPQGTATVLPISRGLFVQLHGGDRLTFVDLRGKPGTLDVIAVGGHDARALCRTTAYLETGLPLSRDTGTGSARPAGTVGRVPRPARPLGLPLR